jgi:hypothetical protein
MEMKVIENAEITVTIRIRDHGEYTYKTMVETEERIAVSATIGEITDRLAGMVDSVHSKTVHDLARISAAEVEQAPVDMVAVAKSAAGIK